MLDTSWEDFRLLISIQVIEGGRGSGKVYSFLLDHLSQADFFNRLENEGRKLYVLYSITAINDEAFEIIQEAFLESGCLYE